MITDQKPEDMIIRYNWPLYIKRSIQELQGIATAITYDGKIDDNEIRLLMSWVTNHADIQDKWPICDIIPALKKIYEAGKATPAIRNKLLEYLKSFATDTSKDTVVNGIFDDEAEVVFRDREFMFTGQLTFGDRDKAKSIVESRGGVNAKTSTIRPSLNYLVVGAMGNEAWKYGRFGTKIELALSLQRSGKASNLKIIREKRFVEAVINHSA